MPKISSEMGGEGTLSETGSGRAGILTLKKRVQETLAKAGLGRFTVIDLEPITGGACQDNFSVKIELEGGPLRLCLRSDAATSLPGSIARRQEFEVIGAAVSMGVPTANARWLTEGLIRNHGSAYFLDWLDGETIGARVTKHPRFEAARRRLPEQLAGALASIHRITPTTHSELPLSREPFLETNNPLVATLSFVRSMLDQLPEARPASELVWRWLKETMPDVDRLTLVHADFRTGNFMVNPDGLVGVLDWEFAHWGDPIEDLGWLCVRDWRFGCVDRPAGGLTTREDFCALYEQAAGVEVPPARLHWWEVCGNLRWGVAAAIQGQRYIAGGDFELLAIPRRAVEMEYEALRLMEVGPS
jgi:aminoglycoside phosphotransferase (APT) family kinase protein